MTIIATIKSSFTKRALPYEESQHVPSKRAARTTISILAALSVLEVLAFVGGSVFSTIAVYCWILLGLVSFGFLVQRYVGCLLHDAKQLSLWGLVPLLASVIACFAYIKGYGFLNTESLSELQHSLEQLQRSDLGYTQMFWVSYPSRSLLLSLLPSTWMGITPEAYRVGFSFPLMLGAVFFYSGLRLSHERHPLSAAISGLVAASIFAFPMLVEFTRTFEMATSSTSYGLWAIAALLLFVSRPSSVSALTCAWAIGLLGASFTSGLALVALLLFALTAWLIRTLIQRDYALAGMIASVLLYSSVVTIALYLQQPRMLRSQPITFAEMWGKFIDGLTIVTSFGKTAFFPFLLVIPLIMSAVFALALRAGLIPFVAVAWCFPVVWSAVNMQGKIAPLLPFCLYRALVIIPVISYVFALFLFWLTARCGRATIVWRLALPVCAVAIVVTSNETYRRHRALEPNRPAWGRESVVEEVTKLLPEYNLQPGTRGILVNRIDDPSIETFLPCAQYLMYGWRRVPIQEQIPPSDAQGPQPIIIVTTKDNQALSQEVPGLTKSIRSISVTRHERPPLELAVAIFLPESR